jgi:hypothetical protein
MVDREIAFDLGKRLLYANLLVHEMRLELDAARGNPLSRTTLQIVEETKEKVLRPAYLDRIEELDRKLGASTPDAMLRTLQECLDELLK